MAQAITEPDSETAPIAAPITPSTSEMLEGACPSPENRSSSTAPIAAAEPPPMPLYSATICGMSVIATFLPDTHASTVPMPRASTISARLCRPGNRNVATVAITMPMPAQRMPLRAVTGEAMRCRPSRNSVAATK